jgi:hypothetical protein
MSDSQHLWHLTETYKALITISVEALKMSILINGGAAVAVLTYAGNSHITEKTAVTFAVLYYAGGVAAAMFAFILAYVAQLRLYIEERKRHSGQSFRQTHHWLLALDVISASGSVVLFGCGCIAASNSI